MQKRTRWELFRYMLQRPPEERTEGRLRSFLFGLIPVCLLTLLSISLHRTSIFEKLELADADKLMRVGEDRPASSRPILVLISDDDYLRIFGGTSPLAPTHLLRLVKNTCLLNPKRIGVDILTSDWTPEQTRQAQFHLDEIKRSGCNVVWIRDADPAENRGPESSSQEVTPEFLLGEVVGQKTPSQGVCAALPLFFPDADGVIRNFRKTVPAFPPGTPQSQAYATLVGALAYPGSCGFTLREELAQDSGSERKIRFGVTDNMTHLPAGQIYALDPNATNDSFRLALQQQFKDATVIIGGAYRTARDRYATPIGYLFGAEIIGDAISSVYDPIPIVSTWLLTASELAVDVFCLGIVAFLALRLPLAVLLSVALSIGAALLLSCFLFHFAGYFLGLLASTLSIFLGSIVELLFDYSRNDWETWHEKFKAFRTGEL